MALQVTARKPAASEVAVSVVDTDVHPVPRPGVLTQYLPEPYRSQYFARRRKGESITYDAPDYAHAKAMRADTFPADGGFPGSDPELTFEQLVVEAGVDIGILIPLGATPPFPELEAAYASAQNHWLVKHWLDTKTNWHRRWRGSINVAISDPQGAVREIEHWAESPDMVQIQISSDERPSWGDPKYYPIWEAAARYDLPIATHTGHGSYEYAMTPVGAVSYNHEFRVSISLRAVNQITSLIYEGVFDRFPTLKFVFVEFASNWVLPLLWRMDKYWEARRADIPWVKRKPSEYVYDHIRFSTQPLDYPEDTSELSKLLTWMDAGRILLFSTDYPHWTFDDPKFVMKHLPKDQRARIMYENSVELYKLPRTVPGYTM